jgi:hypothetical protein
VDLKFLFFYFAINQNGCGPLWGMKTDPVRRMGNQDVPGVDVRKLVRMAWVSDDYVPDAGDNSQI